MPNYTLRLTTPNSARIDLPGGTSIIVTSDSKLSVTVMPDCAKAEDASKPRETDYNYYREVLKSMIDNPINP